MEPTEIKARCRAIGLTNAALASSAGVDPATLSRVKNGRVSPVVRTLDRIKGALDAAERARRDELVARHGLPDLPAEVDVVMVGGVMRRLVKPVLDPRENAA